MVTVCSLWFQLSDCYRGVVFDGLETLFARNAAIALLCLLKAIGNREYIYVLTMVQDYAAMKAQEKAKKEQEGKAHTPWAVLCRPYQVFPRNRALGFFKSFPAAITPPGLNETVILAAASVPHLRPVRWLGVLGSALQARGLRQKGTVERLWNENELSSSDSRRPPLPSPPRLHSRLLCNYSSPGEHITGPALTQVTD